MSGPWEKDINSVRAFVASIFIIVIMTYFAFYKFTRTPIFKVGECIIDWNDLRQVNNREEWEKDHFIPNVMKIEKIGRSNYFVWRTESHGMWTGHNLPITSVQYLYRKTPCENYKWYGDR